MLLENPYLTLIGTAYFTALQVLLKNVNVPTVCGCFVPSSTEEHLFVQPPFSSNSFACCQSFSKLVGWINFKRLSFLNG